MSGKDRRLYLSATVLDQDFLDWCHDNMETQLEMVVEIETPTGTIYASDRNKYVGSTWYEALVTFPTINRTIGEWLAPDIQFSSLTIALNNPTGRFNNFLPGGVNYDAFIGRSLVVKLGLAEQSATYFPIFSGKITDIAGVSRQIMSLTFIARDKKDDLLVTFPNINFNTTDYPNIEDGVLGKAIPVIYGDYTVNLAPDDAVIPCLVVNGNDPNVKGGTRTNIQLVISVNANRVFDDTNVYLFKSDVYYLVTPADVGLVSVNKNAFQIQQNAGTWFDGAQYEYTQGDRFVCRMKGKDLGAYSENPVWQARDLLMTYGGLISGDFDANWVTYRDKASPAQSAISTIKSRIWEDDPKPLITYVLSILEQVRIEAFIDMDLQIKLSSLHFEDWIVSPTHTITNFDVGEGSLETKIDEKNNINRIKGVFDLHPIRSELANTTATFRNDASIAQIQKTISKQITFPNLYIKSEVELQVKEILRLSSSIFETVNVHLTWRSVLKDIGDFVLLDIRIGATIFQNVPAMIRDFGYDPQGMRIPVSLWSFQLVPFPGYVPGYVGTVGGYAASLTQE